MLPPRYKPTGKSFDGGGMSATVVCTDTHLDRLVLVKSLEIGVDQKRILDEIAALSDLRSKHVVEIYDVIRDKSGKAIAFVEELISGDDLNSKIPVKLPEEFLLYSYAISSGLADIHSAGRVHRDIKPNNMKFDDEGCLRIFDFGLSRDEAGMSTKGTLGTPGYLAPELCVPPGSDVTFTSAVDTFAFAATVLKLIRGKLPADMRTVPPKLPCAEADFGKQTLALPAPISDMLNQCLSVDPALRPSMLQIRDLLSSYLVQWRHRATMIVAEEIYTLDKDKKRVKLLGAGGDVSLEYDGISFNITEIGGSAYINNIPCKVGDRLPGSCVLMLSSSVGWGRVFITIDISYPEVGI